MDSQKLSQGEVTSVEKGIKPATEKNSEISGISKTPELAHQVATSYLSGTRLLLVKYAFLLAQFLVAMESSIVGTSIVSIATDLGSSDRAQLVFTMYLVCYAGFIMVIGKISDVIGRRVTFFASTLIFTAFSAGCGASKTMTQLVIFRTFQGLGAGGIQAISIIIIPDLIQPHRMLNYSSVVSMTMILGLIIGLFLGGWISNEGAWRWVFYINGPCGASVLLAVLALPWNHPPRSGVKDSSIRSSLKNLRKVDWLGCILLIGGSVPLLFALIEAEVLVPWRSASIIACLVLSGISWIGLVFQQMILYKRDSSIKPLLPVELFTKKFSAALLVSSFWFGFPYYGIMLTLPRRFTLVQSSSPMRAAIQTLPMIAVVPFVIVAVNMSLGRLVSKPKLAALAALMVLIACTIIQIISIATLTTASANSFSAGLYVAIAFVGVGNGPYLGVSFSMLSKYARMATHTNPSDALGALNQFRILGGAIGLAVNSRLLTSHIISSSQCRSVPGFCLQLARNPEVVNHLTDESLRLKTQDVLNQGFNHAFIFQACAASVAFLALLLLLEKRK